MEIAFLFSFLVVFATYFISGSISSFAISLFTLALGILFAQTIKPEYRRTGLKLFFIVFSVYTVFAILHYLGFYYDYYNFEVDWRDEYKFFSRSQMYEKVPLSQIWQDCFVHRVHIENEGYNFYIAALSSIAHSLFDGNHLLYQFLGTTLCASLLSILMYRFLLIYVDHKAAYKYALVFLLISVFLQYSISLLRDIFIAFFFLWGFIIVSQKFTVKGLIGLIVLALIIGQFRYEHGFFFVIFILYYLYQKFPKYRTLFVVVSVIVAVISSTFIFEHISKLSRTLSRYSVFTEESALSKDDSIGRMIWLLPTPIREIVTLINSQIQPFPAWVGFENSKNIFDGIVSFHKMLYPFFWFSIMFALVKWVIVEKMYKVLSSELILLSLIALIFLIGNTSNMILRRIMCVYPIFYLIYVMLRETHISKANIRNTFAYSTLTYLSLILIYLVVKYV